MKKHTIFTVLLLLTAGLIFAGGGIGISKKRALIIAIGNYSKKSGYYPIHVENDVTYIIKALVNFGFNENSIKVLSDSDATYRGILAALDSLYYKSREGDIIHVHFSGHGQQVIDDNGDEPDGYDEALVTYDAKFTSFIDVEGINLIRDDEINEWIDKLRKKIGPAGQVVLSMDASHSGPDEASQESDQPGFMTTRGGFIEITSKGSANQAPIIVFSSCLFNEISSETTTDEGPIGVWSYAFYLASVKVTNYDRDEQPPVFKTLGDTISSISGKFSPRQHPVTAGFIQSTCYEPDLSKRDIYSPQLETISSNVYLLSIGISNYTASPLYSFANCDDDAVKFSELIREQHRFYASDSSRIYAYELLNEEATRQNIIDRLNLIISSAQPDDYFFFNFSGYSWEVPDSTGSKEICFFPYVTYDVSIHESDSFLDRSDKISLHQIRDLMEFIPAQNQLLVTEAGLTPGFRTDFAKAMIETSPAISQLTRRNRVIIVPEKYGQDSYLCNGSFIQGGPIMNFLVQAGSSVSMFGLFSGDDEVRKTTQYALMKEEFHCREFGSPYMSFFFERDFVKDIQYYLEDYGISNRGAGTLYFEGQEELGQIGQPHALVIGTNSYSKGSPQWKDLSNPVEDARGISSVLKSEYGYHVRTLYDPPVDTLIAALKQYSRILNEEDQFILFIAGHGDYDPYFFDDGFLVMSNSLATSKDPYRRTYLPFTQLRNIVDNLPARQIMLMIDVCFGGAFDEKISAGPSRSGSSPYADVSMDRLIKDKLPLKTRIVLSSGSLNEVPDGYEGKHSPFAARIINCLNTRGGADGFLTTIQLYDFVQRLPSKPVRGELQGNEGGAEFFLIAR